MNTLIMYISQHGCTEKCAEDLKQLLNGHIEVVNLKQNKKIDLAHYDRIILGGSIHAGKVQRNLKKFMEKHMDALKTKKLGLYLCCMEENEKAEQQFNNAFPEELRNHATATSIFGGEFNFDRMNFVESAIIKKIAKIDQNTSKIDQEKIKAFAKTMS